MGPPGARSGEAQCPPLRSTQPGRRRRGGHTKNPNASDLVALRPGVLESGLQKVTGKHGERPHVGEGQGVQTSQDSVVSESGLAGPGTASSDLQILRAPGGLTAGWR